MIPYSETVIRILITDNYNRFGGINTPYTTDLIYYMCHLKIERGISYFNKIMKTQLLNSNDIRNELYETIRNCVINFDYINCDSFSLYVNHAINHKVERLVTELQKEQNTSLNSLGTYHDVKGNLHNNEISAITERSTFALNKIYYTKEQSTVITDLFAVCKFIEQEKKIIALILKDTPIKDIVDEFGIELFKQTKAKIAIFFKKDHGYIIQRKNRQT